MTDSTDIGRFLKTIKDFIRWGASRMNAAHVVFGHGTDNAIDEAAALVLHALHLPPDLPDTYLDCQLTNVEKQAVLGILERRVRERCPAPYLMHQAWFMGLSFYVDERVLIPRSPLAEVIERRFAPWIRDPEAVAAILDLGTGSGCIGIGCAYAFPDARVDLSDVSSEALAVARRNVAEHGLEEQVELIPANLFQGLEGRRYDLIVSNPPYVGSVELAGLPAEYRHEPVQALAAGEDGLDLVVPMLIQAPEHLKPGGILVVEVGSAEEALLAAFPTVDFLWLDFEHGGEGVFLLTREELLTTRETLQAYSGPVSRRH